MLYLTKDTFDAVSISMPFVSKIEAMFSAGSLEWNRAIIEKDCVVYFVFLAKFREKSIRNAVRSREFNLRIQEIVRLGIDSGVQLVLLIVKLNHRLIDSNVIRRRPGSGCRSALWTQS